MLPGAIEAAGKQFGSDIAVADIAGELHHTFQFASSLPDVLSVEKRLEQQQGLIESPYGDPEIMDCLGIGRSECLSHLGSQVPQKQGDLATGEVGL